MALPRATEEPGLDAVHRNTWDPGPTTILSSEYAVPSAAVLVGTFSYVFASLDRDHRHRVRFRGIDARVWSDGEQWWALDEGGTDVFGEGDTRDEAVLDLVASIGTMMADLAANRDRLSDHAADQLRRFERALAEE